MDRPVITDTGLEAPGAGLPVWENTLLNRIFRLTSPLISWNLALRLFMKEGNQLLHQCENLSQKRIHGPILIPRLMGLEDSSRQWSPAMVLEHLMITGKRMAEIITALCENRPAGDEVRIEAVKPKGNGSAQIIADYGRFLTHFQTSITPLFPLRRARSIHAHPWFGELTAHQWLCLAAIHQRIHRRQLQSILAHGS